jgi:hypothetical protein
MLLTMRGYLRAQASGRTFAGRLASQRDVSSSSTPLVCAVRSEARLRASSSAGSRSTSLRASGE